MLQVDGHFWRSLEGKEARDPKNNVLGMITDQYIDDGELVCLINDDYEIVVSDAEEIIFPEKYVVLI